MNHLNGSSSEGLIIFHIAENLDWEKPGENYQPSSFLKEGFVHLSTRSQVLATAKRYFTGRSDLVLIAVRASALPQSLVYENLVGGDQLFPHYYGVIPRDAVVRSEPLSIDAEGRVSSKVLDLDF